MIDKNTAENLLLASLKSPEGDELVILETIEKDIGWIFFWNSRRYAEGNQEASLCGNHPCFVYRHTGKIQPLHNGVGKDFIEDGYEQDFARLSTRWRALYGWFISDPAQFLPYFLPARYNRSLLTAIQVDDDKIVAEMLQRGADVNTQEEGCTALMYAVASGNPQIVRLLLDRNVEVNAVDPNGYTALGFAVIQGHITLIPLLLTYGADPNAGGTQNWDILYMAAILGHLDVVNLLLTHGADVHGRRENGYPLAGAAISGNKDIVQLFLMHGADVNFLWNGGTALMSAAGKGHTEIVKLLLDASVEVNRSNERGWTALHFAVDHLRFQPDQQAFATVELLLQAGADVKMRNDRGQSVLALAKEGGNPILISRLRKAVLHRFAFWNRHLP